MLNKPQATDGHAMADPGPGQVVLQPRDVRFDWAGLPLRWVPEEPQASHVLSTLHLLLPEGERWFVATFKRALPLIRDEELLPRSRRNQAGTRPVRSVVSPDGNALVRADYRRSHRGRANPRVRRRDKRG